MVWEGSVVMRETRPSSGPLPAMKLCAANPTTMETIARRPFLAQSPLECFTGG